MTSCPRMYAWLLCFLLTPLDAACGDPEPLPARALGGRNVEVARKTVADQHAAPADRVAAVRVLGCSSMDEDLRLLTTLLVPQTPLEVQLATVDAIRDMPNGHVSEALLLGWTGHGPRVHTAAVAGLLWREPWLGVLDEQSAERPELAAALDWALRDIALRHPSQEIRVRAERLLKGRPTSRPELEKAIERFLPALRIKGDINRGKKIFTEATCANCHKLDDVGRHIGPDLSRLVDKSPRTLLVDTIDPNRVVDHRFVEYTLLTSEGLQIAGLLLDEASDHLTLADVNGESHVVLRKNIDELVSNRRSQMPEGLEGKLKLQQMADLIAFMIGTAE